MKYNIGDKVICLGKHHQADSGMNPKIGTVGSVIKVDSRDALLTYRVKWEDGTATGNSVWAFTDDIAPCVESKIVITSDGKTTLARLYDGNRVIRRAEAKCSPEDTYDFAAGADLAYDRLMRPTDAPQDKPEAIKLYCVKSYDPGHWCTKGKIYEIDADGGITHDDGWVEIDFLPFMRRGGRIYGDGTEWEKYLVPLVSRPAKAGEWVLVTNAHNDGTHINAEIHNGDILQVDMVDSSNRPAKTASNTWLWKDEFLVLDGYDGRYEQTEPKYFNGKVVCVEAHFHLTNSFTAGKVYTFENGKVVDNDGDARPLDDAMETLDEWNEEHGGIAKFIEYKGEAT